MSNKTVSYVKCACDHEQQDKMYGSKVRVANLTQKGPATNTSRTVRCTVCGREHSVSVGNLK